MRRTMSQRVKYSRAHPLRNLWAETSQKTPRKLTSVLNRKPHAPGLVALGDGSGVGVQSRAHCNSHILVNKSSLPCCKTNQHKHQQELDQSLGSAGSSQTSPTKKNAYGELCNPVSGAFFPVITLTGEGDTLDKLFTGRKVILPLSSYI